MRVSVIYNKFMIFQEKVIINIDLREVVLLVDDMNVYFKNLGDFIGKLF